MLKCPGRIAETNVQAALAQNAKCMYIAGDMDTKEIEAFASRPVQTAPCLSLTARDLF